MSLREQYAPVNVELDALIHQAVRSGVVNRSPAVGVRRQLIERASEQYSLGQPRLTWLKAVAWLDSLFPSQSVWNYRPQYSPLPIDNFYLVGAYRICWRWFM